MSRDECQRRVYAIENANDDQKVFRAERVEGLAGAASMMDTQILVHEVMWETVVLFSIHFRTMKVTI